jgi:hypothetical protein
LPYSFVYSSRNTQKPLRSASWGERRSAADPSSWQRIKSSTTTPEWRR